MKLSIIVPAYNEEKRLPSTLREIDKYLSKQSYNSEIIVVNGGSTDRTAEVVRGMMREIKNLKLIERDGLGKGDAVKTGILTAEGEYRIFTDADNSTSIDHIGKMWPYFERGCDVVVGSRDIKGAILDPPQPWWRRLLGLVFRLFTQITCGTWGISDSQCGFKGFTKKAASKIFPKTKIYGFAFDPEVLVIAKKLGYKIKEIPITWKNDPESKVKFKNMVKMGIDLLKIRWNLITKKYKI